MKKAVTSEDIEQGSRKGKFVVTREMIITPLARDYAQAHDIQLVSAEEAGGEGEQGGGGGAGREGGAGSRGDRGTEEETLERKVLEKVRERLGKLEHPPGHASASGLNLFECARCHDLEHQRRTNRAIITTTGQNRTGIVARITQVIAECGGDILDISQTIVSDFFTMIIVVDIAALAAKGVTFRAFKEKLNQAAGELGVESMVMHEDILASMHRI